MLGFAVSNIIAYSYDLTFPNIAKVWRQFARFWMRNLLQSKLPCEWSLDLRNGDD